MPCFKLEMGPFEKKSSKRAWANNLNSLVLKEEYCLSLGTSSRPVSRL